MSDLHVLPLLAPHVERRDCPCGPLASMDDAGDGGVYVHRITDPRGWTDSQGRSIEGYWPSPELEAVTNGHFAKAQAREGAGE